MSARLLPSILLVVFSVSVIRAQTGTITGVVYERETPDGNDSVLVSVDSEDKTVLIDEVILEIGKKAAVALTLGHAPAGWEIAVDGKNVVVSGPPTSTVDIRLDAEGNIKLPKDCTLEANSGGQTVFSEKVSIESLPSYDPLASEILRVPEVVVAGGPAIVGINVDVSGPQLAIHWSGALLTTDADDVINWLSVGIPEIDFVRQPGIAAQVAEGISGPVSAPLTILDRWGNVIIDTRLEFEVQAPFSESSCSRLTDVSPYAFTGEPMCVQGQFNDAEAFNSLEMGGVALGAPRTASGAMATFNVPSATITGRQSVQFAPYESAGSCPNDPLSIQILEITGFIDQNVLRRGQSTPLTLQVIGTEDVLCFELHNYSPEIVRLDRGNHQRRCTSGGPQNEAGDTVHAVSPGNFNISYTFDVGACDFSDLIAPEACSETGATCDDGDPCTTADVCGGSGACMGTPLDYCEAGEDYGEVGDDAGGNDDTGEHEDDNAAGTGSTPGIVSTPSDTETSEADATDVAPPGTSVRHTSGPGKHPPVAVCKDMLYVADAVNCDADVTVDGGSYDPDGDAIVVEEQWVFYSSRTPRTELVKTWETRGGRLVQVGSVHLEGRGNMNYREPTRPFRFKLVVTDADGMTDTCEGIGSLKDDHQPVATAGLAPVSGEVDDDEGEFEVVVGCWDNCGVNKRIVKLHSLDQRGNPVGGRDHRVQDGQTVDLEIGRYHNPELDDGVLEWEADGFELRVVCIDHWRHEASYDYRGSGVGTMYTTVQPRFANPDSGN